MADVTIGTIKQAQRGGAILNNLKLGEAVGPGVPIYNSGGEWFKAHAVTDKWNARGITLFGGDIGDFVSAFQRGIIDLGATLVIGERYYVSKNLGMIMPSTDIVTGNHLCYLGTGLTANNLDQQIHATGAIVP